MSTTATPTLAPIANYTTDERFYATRYRQGGRTVFLIALTPDQVVNNIIKPNPDLPNPGNRQIRLSHAQGFAKYYLEHDSWVIPGLILRAPNIFEFTANLDPGDGHTEFGILSYPKRMQRDIQILDGQHRILGFHLALEAITDQIGKARDHAARAKRTEDKGSKVIREADAEVRRLEKKRDRFYQERVAVEIQVTEDLKQYRQMFFDIAENAKGISASVKARFDTSKVINRALPLVLEHPLLENRVDPENDRLGRTGPYLLSAKHVTQIIHAVNVGIDGRMGKHVERELSENQVAEKTKTFFDILVAAFPPLTSVKDGTLLPDRLRQTSLLGSPGFLRILAGTYWELRTKHAFSDHDVQDYFTALAPHTVAPVHDNSIWRLHTPEDTFNANSTGPNGRRQDVVNLSRVMWEWAIDKPTFVYSAPLPAPEVSVDEDAGIDFALGHDTKALEVAEREAAEDIAKTGRAKAAAIKK